MGGYRDDYYNDPPPDEEEEEAPVSPFVAKLIADARAAKAEQDEAPPGESRVRDDYATSGEPPADEWVPPARDDWNQPPPDTYAPPARDDWAQPRRDWGDTNAPPPSEEAPPPEEPWAPSPARDDWAQPPADTFEPDGRPGAPVRDDWAQPQRDWGNTNIEAPPEAPPETFEPDGRPGAPVRDDWATTNEPTADDWNQPSATDAWGAPVRDDWNQPQVDSWGVPFAEAIGATTGAVEDGGAVGRSWGAPAPEPSAWGTPTPTEIPEMPFGLGGWADVAEAAGTPNAVSTARARWEATQTAADRAEATAEARDAAAARTATAAAVRDQRQAAGTATAEARREAGVQATETARERAAALGAIGTATAEARRAAATGTAEARAEQTAEARTAATQAADIRRADATAAAEGTAQARGTATAEAAEARGTATAEAQARTAATHAAATATREAGADADRMVERAVALEKQANDLTESAPKDINGQPIPGAPDPGAPARAEAARLRARANEARGLPADTPTPTPTATGTPTPTATPTPGWLDRFRAGPPQAPLGSGGGVLPTDVAVGTPGPGAPVAATPGLPAGLGLDGLPAPTATRTETPVLTEEDAQRLAAGRAEMADFEASGPPGSFATAPPLTEAQAARLAAGRFERAEYDEYGGPLMPPSPYRPLRQTTLPSGLIVDERGQTIDALTPDWRRVAPYLAEEEFGRRTAENAAGEIPSIRRVAGVQAAAAVPGEPRPGDPNALPVPGGDTRASRGIAGVPRGAALRPVGPTTVDLAPGSAPGRAVDLPSGLARVHRDALAAGLDEEGAQVAMAVALTEGGMGGAIGDRDQGAGSGGTFQLFFGPPGRGGQGNNYARATGTGDAAALAALAADPHSANSWALGGYLGAAIKEGQRQGLHGAALAEFAQRTGQVSVHPERAARNFDVVTAGAGGLAAAAAGGRPGPAASGARPGDTGALPPVVAQRTGPGAAMPDGTPLPGTEGALPGEWPVGRLHPAGALPPAVPRAPGAPGARVPGAPGRPRPTKTGNEAVDNANWITWMREQDPSWVPPAGAPETPEKAAAVPRAAAIPREPTNKPKAEPNAPKMTTSPTGYYRLSDGTTKSIAEMREGLRGAGWTGNYESDQDVLAGYARTTGKTLTPSGAPPPAATPAQRAQVARWTPNITKVNAGTNVPADVVLAAIHTISLGDPTHAGGLLGVPASQLQPGENPADGESAIRAGTRVLSGLYKTSGIWAEAFKQYLGLMGVPPAQMDAILEVFNQERNVYQPAGTGGAAAPGGFVPGTLVPAA